MLVELDQYDISAERGFLCRYDAAAVTLPGDFARARTVAMGLPDSLPSGRIRAILAKDLPDTLTSEDVAKLSDAQTRMAMVHYSFMVQALSLIHI